VPSLDEMAVKFNQWCKVSMKPLARIQDVDKGSASMTKAQ